MIDTTLYKTIGGKLRHQIVEYLTNNKIDITFLNKDDSDFLEDVYCLPYTFQDDEAALRCYYIYRVAWRWDNAVIFYGCYHDDDIALYRKFTHLSLTNTELIGVYDEIIARKRFEEEDVEPQYSLYEEIRDKSQINIVYCGFCGELLLHRRNSSTVYCGICCDRHNVEDCGDAFLSPDKYEK